MKRIAIFIIIIVFLLIGCNRENNKLNKIKDNITKPTEIENKQKEDRNITEDKIQNKLDNMTLDEKIGQMIIAGFSSYNVDEKVKTLIKDYNIGGLILFNRNIKSSDQLVDLLNSIKEENKNNIPLFLAVDQEGGRVNRMPKDIINFPSNIEIGYGGNEDLAYDVGSAIGQEIKSYGFNLNFAPVIDIFSNKENKVIGDRAFGKNEKIVSEFGISKMKGLQSKGIIPVIKHFPGHGDTSVDSHMGLPIIKKDIESLSKFELIPFKRAIDNGADMVMIAHILLSKIDDKPATLSKKVITELLRGKLGFKGVIITDDLEMDAITDNYSIEETVLKAIDGGNDILLICHSYNKQIKAFDIIKEEVKAENIPIERINKSVYRILKLKSKYGLSNDKKEYVDIERINNNNRRIINILKDK
ncbi:beta-N-acetylhexosaminidase [Dethiothermospora halolimnae]|uniref:beta-N-acetylhexosaminidase n=1 Tax=Dethiothermospora halolimnae TaxID=3114390 RepID=UPI003CCBE531